MASSETIHAIVLAHQPSRWRSFSNDMEVLRCCGQDFGNYSRAPRKGDATAFEAWAKHLADAIVESVPGDSPTN